MSQITTGIQSKQNMKICQPQIGIKQQDFLPEPRQAGRQKQGDVRFPDPTLSPRYGNAATGYREAGYVGLNPAPGIRGRRREFSKSLRLIVHTDPPSHNF
jgi:hypothetical protein